MVEVMGARAPAQRDLDLFAVTGQTLQLLLFMQEQKANVLCLCACVCVRVLLRTRACGFWRRLVSSQDGH